jgi:hypothetical protein
MSEDPGIIIISRSQLVQLKFSNSSGLAYCRPGEGEKSTLAPTKTCPQEMIQR